jgi:tripartite-type tricarboxylate transporter receptor subunit TctC
VLCVKPDFPASTGQEFVEQIRKNPGKYTYGTDGVGGVLHLAVERIFVKVGAKARPVPFGGAGETLKNFLGGHVDIYGGAVPTILPSVKNGSAKCLLLTSANRLPVLPQAASLTDLGIPEAQTLVWNGLIAPKNVPADRLAILENAFRQALTTERFKQYATERGLTVEAKPSAEFRKLIDSEYAAMGDLARQLGLSRQ